jgi:hypothetical protein
LLRHPTAHPRGQSIIKSYFIDNNLLTIAYSTTGSVRIRTALVDGRARAKIISFLHPFLIPENS